SVAHPTVDLLHQPGEVIGPRNPFGGLAFVEAAVVDQLDRKPANRLDLFEHLGLELAGHIPDRTSAGGSLDGEYQPYRNGDGLAFPPDAGERGVGFAAASDGIGQISRAKRTVVGPEDVKFRKTQETRQRKPSKRLKRQEPERKEKYRERQGRANRKQHHKLSKPSTRHDMQRQRRVTKAKLSYRLNLTDTALLPARSNGASGGN